MQVFSFITIFIVICTDVIKSLVLGFCLSLNTATLDTRIHLGSTRNATREQGTDAVSSLSIWEQWRNRELTKFLTLPGP
jgi:hypothetical protein